MRIYKLASLTGIAAFALMLASPASALTMAECSTKYNAAKEAGTLSGQTWNQFRKAECGSDAGAAEEAKPEKKARKSKEKAADTETAASAAEAKGLTSKECSAKYQAAKDAGSLNGMKWNDFRKARCGANTSDDDTVPNPTEATYDSEPEAPKVKAPRGVKFPSGVAGKYSSETPGKARLHTCLDQYYANKDADALGGLKWIQKGGGFYSLCNARLKG